MNTTIEAEVIPTLTAENFAHFVAQVHERPIPEGVLEEVALDASGLGHLEGYAAIITEDGSPTSWLVSRADGLMWLRGRVPCSVADCKGHSSIDVDDDWDKLSHKIAGFDMGIEGPDRAEAGAELYLGAEGPAVGYQITLEGEIPVEGVEGLIHVMEQIAGQLRNLAALGAGRYEP